MAGKDSCKRRPQAATRSGILYFFDPGNLIFSWKNQGKVREF